MSFEYPKHVRFECNRCAICCGDTKDRARMILLMRLEADRISEKAFKAVDEFAEKFDDSEPYTYRMKKTADGKCIFLTGNTCKIYQLRPLTCKFYPFELKGIGGSRYIFAYTNECPCIGKGFELKKGFFGKLFSESMGLMRENSRNTGIS